MNTLALPSSLWLARPSPLVLTDVTFCTKSSAPPVPRAPEHTCPLLLCCNHWFMCLTPLNPRPQAVSSPEGATPIYFGSPALHLVPSNLLNEKTECVELCVCTQKAPKPILRQGTEVLITQPEARVGVGPRRKHHGLPAHGRGQNPG